MKNTIFKKITLLATAVLAVQCTGDFENENTNPYGISEESLTQDFNDIGASIPNITRMIVNTTNYRYQIAQNLCSDSWAGYLAPPTPFAGGANNTTYRMTWRDHTWLSTYESIMSPAKQVIDKAEAQGREQFVAWTKLIRIYGMQRLASLHGPVIYSQYGLSATTSQYDSEEVLYNRFFTELDEIQAVLKQYATGFEGFAKFDAAYGGNVSKWLRLSNTLRLQLAMRIVKVAPALTQAQAEKAFADSYGLITTNADNFNVDLGGEVHPLYTIGESWGDTRMSATMESFLVGYKDPRVGAFFSPVSDDVAAELVSDHPDFPYKGIKNGATLVAKDLRTSYSKVGAFFTTTKHHTLVNAAMVNFMLSEAALRGWNVGGTPKDYYEQGVKLSFEQWGVSGADAYLADSSLTPIGYTDPKAAAGVNAFAAQTNITIAWNDSDVNEKKLERIMTQKWIAGFPDSYEAWADFRRTGYPAVEPVYQNDSNSTDGIIPAGGHIRRMSFVLSEYDSNLGGVTDAVQKLGGEDKISTRLWWDVDAPNF